MSSCGWCVGRSASYPVIIRQSRRVSTVGAWLLRGQPLVHNCRASVFLFFPGVKMESWSPVDIPEYRHMHAHRARVPPLKQDCITIISLHFQIPLLPSSMLLKKYNLIGVGEVRPGVPRGVLLHHVDAGERTRSGQGQDQHPPGVAGYIRGDTHPPPPRFLQQKYYQCRR